KKMKKKTLIVILFISTSLNANLIGQNWQWEWVEKQTKNGEDAWTRVISTDILNNVYCFTPYDTVIYINDTSFHHPEQYTTNINSAISKYSDRGTFINALDLYTPPGGIPLDPELFTDSALNIYLSSDFRNQVFIKNTSIVAASIVQPDVFLAKLTPDYDLVWSGLITSAVQDDLRGMVMSNDDYLYLACVHYANTNPQQLNYLNQDTSAPYITPMNTLAKVDLNGNLIWKKEIRSEFLGTDTRDLIIGDDGLLYLTGSAYGHISIDNDTIYHPYYPEVAVPRFLTVFNQEGELVDGYFFDWDIWLWYIKVNTNGDLFVSGSISDTAIIGNDTIIIPENESFGIIGKFSSDLDPIWYQTIINSSFQRIVLDEENLIFSGVADGTVQIADSVLQLGNYYETYIGEFNEVGQLINLIVTNSSKELASNIKIADNCKNPIISGYFAGNAIFGDHTINSSISSVQDGFIGKLIRNVPPMIDLGPDSIYCEEYTLFGPEGFEYYSWNDNISTDNWYTVSDSTTIYFGCLNDNGCWSYDTIKIDIHPAIEIDLGTDTTIRENDTIVLFIADQFESYVWSDGSSSDTITIIGSDYGIGTFPIWVKVTDGPCTETDTLYLTIKSEYGVDEINSQLINIYPNPFTESFILEIEPGFQKLEICDINGVINFTKELDQPNQKYLEIETGNLNRGIYILTITTKDKKLIKKIVKI
ncbi:MAG: T9SS type A sorting domain-containing protein, partial [Bacteroidales bacterium]|nr:T9SS type A sorting domain-containing protein [Bacteroidales bacterium]